MVMEEIIAKEDRFKDRKIDLVFDIKIDLDIILERMADFGFIFRKIELSNTDYVQKSFSLRVFQACS